MNAARCVGQRLLFRIAAGAGVARGAHFVPFARTIQAVLGRDNVEIVPARAYEDYMALMEEGHFALEPFHFGGCNTVVDSLHLRQPIVTLEGSHWYNRIGSAIVRACGLDELLDRAERSLGHTVSRKHTDLGALLAESDIDVVDLVLPTPTMPEAIAASLAAGKHVISEKPCAASGALCSELLAAYNLVRHRLLWAVAENWRFKRMVQIITHLVRRGDLGTLKRVDFHHASLSWQGHQGWRGSTQYGGGYLMDSGVHFVALLRGLAGEFKHVTAAVAWRGDPRVAVSADAHIHVGNEVEGTFRLSLAEDASPAQPHQLCITGSAGLLRGDFQHGQIQVQSSKGTGTIEVPDDPWVQGGVYQLLRHCCNAIYAGTAVECSPWEPCRMSSPWRPCWSRVASDRP